MVVNVMASKVIDAVMKRTKDVSPKKNPAAVALGKLGGKKGGPARAKSLSGTRRSEIARLAAQTRWARESNGSEN
jgi:hypothetical protein